MLLIVLAGEDTLMWEEYESRLLLAREEADEDRRNEVRRLEGANRVVMEWKREVCMLNILDMVTCWSTRYMPAGQNLVRDGLCFNLFWRNPESRRDFY
jgi:hypothetical protein